MNVRYNRITFGLFLFVGLFVVSMLCATQFLQAQQAGLGSGEKPLQNLLSYHSSVVAEGKQPWSSHPGDVNMLSVNLKNEVEFDLPAVQAVLTTSTPGLDIRRGT